MIVHRSFEGDREHCLLRFWQSLIEGEGASLVLSVVGNVRGVDGGGMFTALCSYRGRVKLEFVCVESYRVDGVLDLELDVTLALVSPWLAVLEVEEGDGVICWFHARKQ